MSANNGGPAFPNELIRNMTSGYLLKGGMTLRDYFAAKAMAALVMDGLKRDGSATVPNVAKDAYRMADAMLAEREKGGDE